MSTSVCILLLFLCDGEHLTATPVTGDRELFFDSEQTHTVCDEESKKDINPNFSKAGLLADAKTIRPSLRSLQLAAVERRRNETP